ncbi:alpha/beta fold hydrolase [Acinetobacter sp. ANC 5054]|uniref:alpha/beta fold hydrolase n=1 Tax=Acinetobacter sp. ANC 5054 TaxID=1977877 RepID=UPI001D172A03|nr:alpha/beta hydrolase [Acinetobacter sp. ANC 5054]
MDNIQGNSTFIEMQGLKVYVKTWQPEKINPDLAPIILMHDSLGSVDLWRDFPQQLAAATGRSIYAYDRLGFGQSSAHPDTLKIDFVQTEARQIFKAVLEHFNLHHFIIMGHSVGGGMSVVIAAAYPEQCVGLITIAAQYEVEELTLAGIREAKVGFEQAGQIERLARYHGDKAQWVLNAWTETWLSPEFRDWNLSEHVGGVNCPSLVIHGALDEYATSAQPQKIFQSVHGQAELQILEGLHHMPHKEQPELVSALIADFVQDLK